MANLSPHFRQQLIFAQKTTEADVGCADLQVLEREATVQTVAFKKSCLSKVMLTRQLGWNDLREAGSKAKTPPGNGST